MVVLRWEPCAGVPVVKSSRLRVSSPYRQAASGRHPCVRLHFWISDEPSVHVPFHPRHVFPGFSQLLFSSATYITSVTYLPRDWSTRRASVLTSLEAFLSICNASLLYLSCREKSASVDMLTYVLPALTHFFCLAKGHRKFWRTFWPPSTVYPGHSIPRYLITHLKSADLIRSPTSFVASSC